MDVVAQQLVESLTAQGPIGLIALGLGYTALHLHKQLMAVQERRVRDALKFADAAHTFANALDRNTETLERLLES